MTVAQANPIDGEDQLIIYPTRTRLTFIAVGSALFVLILFFINAPADGYALWKYRIAVLLGIPFFMLTFVYAIYRLLARTPALIASRTGMCLSGTALGPGWLAWHEIAELRITQFKNQKFLSVTLVDEPAVMSRMNFFVQLLAKMNKGLTGCPFHIPQAVIPMSAEELMRAVQEYRSTIAA